MKQTFISGVCEPGGWYLCIGEGSGFYRIIMSFTKNRLQVFSLQTVGETSEKLLVTELDLASGSGT